MGTKNSSGGKPMTATINPSLRENVNELAAFLGTSENAFINQCIRSSIDSIYAEHDFSPSQFIIDVRRISGQSTPITPLVQELMKSAFSGLNSRQMCYLKNLIETSVGSGAPLDSQLISRFKKITKSINFPCEKNASDDPSLKASWTSIENRTLPPHKAKGATLKQRKHSSAPAR